MFLEYVLTFSIGLKYLFYLRKNQWKPYKELREIQIDRLKSLLHYSYDYVPYYRRLFKKSGFKPQEFRNVEDIKRIPVTTKQEVKENFLDIMPVGIDHTRCIVTSTSGSTGIPLKLYKGLREAVEDTAAKWYAFSECGARLYDRFVNITGATRSLMLPSQTHVSSRLDPKRIAELLKKINPDVLYVASGILEEISFCDVEGISPRLIFSQVQTLTERHRELARTVFGLEMYDTYGSREFSRLAFECDEHSGLHMITDSAHMEFLDEDGEDVGLGEFGEVVVTGLHNYVMPLIRYNLEDIAVPTDERCECGRSWPMIKSIKGRTREYFTMPSGRKINPWFILDVISKELKGKIFIISQYQIIQEKRSKILVKFIKGRDFNPKIVLKIKQGIKLAFHRMNEEVNVEINIVDGIPKGKSGKRQMIVSMGKNHH